MDWDDLRYWLKARDIITCFDAQSTGWGYGLLRTLPAIDHVATVMIDAPQYTYPKQWRQLGDVAQFGMFPHEWIRLQDISNVESPFGILTNEHYEQESPYTISPAISKVRHVGQTVFLISDIEDFKLEMDSRPLADHGYVKDIGEYADLYTILNSHYTEHGYPHPLSDSRNLFLQDNAIIYNNIHDPASDISAVEDLFDRLPDAPYLPLYSAMTRIFNRDDSFGAVALPDTELVGFRKWLQWRIDRSQSECRDLAETINGRVLDENTVFTVESQIEHKTFNRAREFVASLDPGDNPIERKYVGWIQGVTRHEF
jgi:hypothetical protein